MQASPFTYRCFDLVTFVPLDPMPFTGVSFGDQLNGGGSFSGTLAIADPSVTLLDWERSTRPDAVAIVVDFLGTPVWSGWVTNRKYQRSARSYVVTAQTFDRYFAQRLQAGDYTNPNPSAPFWGANPADPTVIAAQILYDSQQESLTFPGDNIGFICATPLYANGVNVLINGNAPPNIQGLSGKGWTQNGLDVILMQGINPGVVVGSVVSGPHMATGAVTYVNQISNQPTLNGTATWTGITSVVRVVMTTNRAPVTGMLVAADGMNPGLAAYVVGSVTYVRHNTYDINVGNNTTVGHPGGTPCIITGYYAVSNSFNASAGSAYTGDTYSFSTAAGLAPTPEIEWITGSYPVTQLSHVNDIINALSQMGYGAGFDYSYDTTYVLNSVPTTTLNISYPRKGKSGSAVTLAITAEMLIELEYVEDATNQAFGLIATASGSGGIASQVFAEPALYFTDGYAVLESGVSYSQVNTSDQLAALARGDLAVMSNPIATPAITVPLAMPDSTSGVLDQTQVGFADFVTGDDFTLRIDQAGVGSTGAPEFGPANDPRFPNGLDFNFRIGQWTCQVPDAGVPTLIFNAELPPVGAQLLANYTLNGTPQTIHVDNTLEFPASGNLNITVNKVPYIVSYTSTDATHFIGVTYSGTVNVLLGMSITPSPPTAPPLR